MYGSDFQRPHTRTKNVLTGVTRQLSLQSPSDLVESTWWILSGRAPAVINRLAQWISEDFWSTGVVEQLKAIDNDMAKEYIASVSDLTPLCTLLDRDCRAKALGTWFDGNECVIDFGDRSGDRYRSYRNQVCQYGHMHSVRYLGISRCLRRDRVSISLVDWGLRWLAHIHIQEPYSDYGIRTT
jgi:hypothetical protein